MRYGLPDNSLQQLLQLFAGQPKVRQVILYGSRAKGNYRPGSDIDLTLVGPELELQDLNRIEQQLDDLLLPWSVDLSLFADIDNPDLIDHIQRVGQVLYER
ncbi:nucleotidyltransferase domain-containing protein [Oceanobacter mangrovi]|uniref:nucleotidyltransferase domain-containing protein n=1 Tax=Oceanobacter mangrovi TaxID=2862510 RepID=UPI001C8E6CF5|nr:nucleotidyltransferase domain-containing protein [Oceanobacter mangrovi]